MKSKTKPFLAILLSLSFLIQTAKVVIYPMIGFFTIWGAVHFYPAETIALKDAVVGAVTVKPVDWAIESMNQFSSRENMPTDIRHQIEDVSRDLTLLKSGLPSGISNAPKAQVNLNLPGKFVLNKEQYMWVENIFNPNTNTTEAVLFITQDNRNGIVTNFMGKIDAKKYEKLISFLKSRGHINMAESGN